MFISRHIIAFVLLAGTAPLVLPRSAAALEDTIIAIVNDDIITLQNLNDFLQSTYMQLKLDGRPESELQQIMREMERDGLQKLIDQKILLTEANRKGVEVHDSVVNKKMEDVQKQYPSKQVFLDALLQDGATVTDLRNKVIEQFKIRFLVENEVRAKIFVNPQEVTEFYAQHQERYKRPERLALDSIYVSRAEDPILSRAKADKALEALKAGKDFAETAKEFSEAASIGTLTKGAMLPEIESAVATLEPGQITDIITVEKGFYIFKLKERLPAEISPLEDVKNEITDTIYQMKYRDRYNTWMQGLKKKAFIDIKNKAI